MRASERRMPMEKHDIKPFTPMLMGILLVIIFFSAFMLFRGNKTRRYRVSVIVSDSAQGRWVPLKAGLQQAARDHNIQLTFVYTDYFNDLNTEIELINREIYDGADGIIAEFVSSTGTQNMISEVTGRVPMELIGTDAEREADPTGATGCVQQDNYQIGRTIGNELVIRFGDALSKEKIGLLTGNQKTEKMKERLRGFLDAVKKKEPDIVWGLEDSRNVEDDLKSCMSESKATLLVGLDNKALETAVNYSTSADFPEGRLFGAGCSEKLVYYLDSDLIASMILPDDFNMGYQSLSDLSTKLENRLYLLPDRTVGFNVVNKENLFRDENQRILFPMMQ